MVFSSFIFLIIYLPVFLTMYYVCPARFRNAILLLASLVFYAWGEPVYVVIMIASIVINYVFGLILSVSNNKLLMLLNVLLNLGALGLFKYTDFAISTVNAITGKSFDLLHIALPIGISFYTFQALSYTVDVFTGEVLPQKNIINFGAYLTMFPQLIAGPIVQYETVADELDEREFSWVDFSNGAYRFVVGLAKKVIIANSVGEVFETIRAYDMSTTSAWIAAIAYTLQIYFDFSGYSDMAIGLGRMLGFHFPENFLHPYEAVSITDFWRRWHVSLSGWFRKYVYIPLGGNRRGMARQLLNLFIVWSLTGLWHGTSYNFVLWGLYYAVLLCIEKLFMGRVLERIPRFFCHIITMILVVIGWAIFSVTDLGELLSYLKVLFGGSEYLFTATDIWFLKEYGSLLIIGALACLNWQAIMDKLPHLNGRIRFEMPEPVKLLVMIILFVLSVAFLVGGSYNPFLYFRF